MPIYNGFETPEEAAVPADVARPAQILPQLKKKNPAEQELVNIYNPPGMPVVPTIQSPYTAPHASAAQYGGQPNIMAIIQAIMQRRAAGMS